MAAPSSDNKNEKRDRQYQAALTWFTAILALAALISAASTAFLTFRIQPQLKELIERQSDTQRSQFESQRYQGEYSTRFGVTNIWREGYPDDTRNRVNKFIIEYTDWPQTSRMESVDILANQRRAFQGEIVRKDKNLRCLLDDDLQEKWLALRGKRRVWRKKNKCEDLDRKWKALSDNDFVEAALKYRNAIIECLNAMEAIESILNTRQYEREAIDKGERKDEKEGSEDEIERRYRDLIKDLKRSLSLFICKYRLANQRDIPPWDNLIGKDEQGKDRCEAVLAGKAPHEIWP